MYYLLPSSRGPGHLPFTEGTRVQISPGAPNKETWPSGRRHFTANEANRKVSRVRISSFPPFLIGTIYVKRH